MGYPIDIDIPNCIYLFSKVAVAFAPDKEIESKDISVPKDLDCARILKELR